MQEPCPVCLEAGASLRPAAELSDRRKGVDGVWHLLECGHCRALSMAPMPSEQQLAAYYEAYPNVQQVNFSEGMGARWPVARRLFHWLTGDVDPRDFVEVKPNDCVLDYGCGHAGYLSDFHRRGVRISGAEIAGYVVEACRQQGFDVRQVSDFSRIPFDDQAFDIVYLMQVFEHLREPHRFMEELRRVLKPGGSLYLAVPNARSFWRKVFGPHWVSGWFAPFHLYHYSQEALGLLAKQHGFELVESWSRTPESWFRLNLKAALLPKERHLDANVNWLDGRVVRTFLMLVLRLVELPVSNRDCLMVKLRKA